MVTPQMVTNMVIQRLDGHPVSQSHWETVADEFLVKANHDLNQASGLLADALKSFHHLYQTHVVKPDNVLDDLLTCCFDLVDWIEVARSRYAKKETR